MSLVQVLMLALVVALAYMTLAWLLSVVRRDASVVDVFWGPGFLVMAALYALVGNGYAGRKALVLLLVAVWAARLAVHIYARNHGRGEDYRYRAFRAKAGASFWWKSYFQVFCLQALLLWLISTPLLAAQWSDRMAGHFTAWDALGALLWAFGLGFEAVGDAQLARFKANPANKGQVLRSGLWASTRHPNYFGEATLWAGYFLLALGTPGGFWTVYSPVLMTLMLLRVSGVALLEKGLAQTKPGYREYMESTSPFIPWFPRRKR
jgi:steroid 5-alpha reductase family enzyme